VSGGPPKISPTAAALAPRADSTTALRFSAPLEKFRREVGEETGDDAVNDAEVKTCGRASTHRRVLIMRAQQDLQLMWAFVRDCL
jgi:hypothetical protein